MLKNDKQCLLNTVQSERLEEISISFASSPGRAFPFSELV